MEAHREALSDKGKVNCTFAPASVVIFYINIIP